MDEELAMTVSDLAAVSHVKEKAVIRNANRIPGAIAGKKGEAIFPDGSRYPYNLRSNKLDTAGKKRLALLDATYHYMFIDHIMLHMTSASFNTMIAELLQVGYLQENGSGNPYGANRYDTTIRYENIRALSRNAQVKEIAYDVASFAGHFCGAFCSENVI